MIIGGIDAGGTATKCVLINEKGKILSEEKGGPANFQVIGLKIAAQEIKEVIKKACIKANVSQIDLLGIGAAGAGSDEDKEKLRAELAKIELSQEIFVTDDGEIAVLGAHAKETGVVVIAGTGSIVYALGKNRERIRAGGWGPLLGDEGSGFWIGLSALKAIIRAAEGRGLKTILSESISRYLKLENLRQLVSLVHRERLPRELIASLTPLVVEGVKSGDGVATKIIEEGLDELVLTTLAVCRKLYTPHPEIAVSGGLFSDSLVFEMFKKKMQQAGDYEVIKPKYPPVYGAIFYAALRKGIGEIFEGGIKYEV